MQLRLEDARRIAVRAQLLDLPRPDTAMEVVCQLTFVQVEPTAAVAPTAELVLWSRLGHAADLAAEPLFELNSLLRPMDDLALFRAEFAEPPPYERPERWLDDNAPFADDILELLDERGPLPARAIGDTSLVPWQSSGWNANRNVVMMLELLAGQGRVAVAGRDGRDRLWDLADRVYHSDVPTVPLADALRIRNERRLHAQGVVPLRTPDLPAETTRIGDAGLDCTIQGVPGQWRVDPAYLEGSFTGRTALLSPFDGLIRDRKRMALLWGFDYALEMYKPAAARRWGFYALPVLHGDRLVGKVDATRVDDRLVVNAIHEDAAFDRALHDAVDAELASLADCLGVTLSRHPA